MQKFSFFIKIVKKAVFLVSLVVLILAVIVAVSARFDIPGGFRIYSVSTGSMEPVIPVGSLIVSKIPTESRDIEKDGVITFEQPGFENKFVTHRVHEVVERGEARFFTTKGDANATSDSWLISYGRVKGIYQRHIPYLGYFLEFLRSPFGIALFVLLPVSLLAIGELKNIGSILSEMKLQKEKSLLKNQKEAKKVKKKKSAKKILIIILFAFFLFSIPQTFALFASEPVEISSISVTTGTWVNPGDAVINEVMWMGSTTNWRDEWIELRNMTDLEIDLSQWTIENARASEQALQIPSGKSIPPDGYFLIASYSESSANTALNVEPEVVNSSISLADSGNGHLILRDQSGAIIDQAKGDVWPAGVHGGSGGVRQSMERNNIPGDGLLPDSWHTCTSVGCNSGAFWKTADGPNYGTPKAANLSENDSTLLNYVASTVTPTPTPTLEPTQSPTPTPTPTQEATPASTPSQEVSPTPTPAPMSEPTPALTPTPSPASEP